MGRTVLVLGGGIAGLQVALDLAERGHQVHVVEREISVGGRAAQWDRIFPSNESTLGMLSARMLDAVYHPNIKVHTRSELRSLSRTDGGFRAVVFEKSMHVDIALCTMCYECIRVCPAKKEDEFNFGLGKRKAIRTLFPEAQPRMTAIDESICVYFLKGKCRLCERFCEPNAIRFDDDIPDRTLELNVQAVIIATGIDPQMGSAVEQYGYGRVPNVLTASEFERLLAPTGPTKGRLERLTDHALPRRLAWIVLPAAGHPEAEEISLLYAAKEARFAKERLPDAQVRVFSTFRRTLRPERQRYLDEQAAAGVESVERGVIGAEELPSSKTVQLRFSSGAETGEEADLVVLVHPMVPRADAAKLAVLLGLETIPPGYFAAPKVTGDRAGLFIAGACGAPMDIQDTIKDASGTAARVSLYLASLGAPAAPAQAAAAVVA